MKINVYQWLTTGNLSFGMPGTKGDEYAKNIPDWKFVGQIEVQEMKPKVKKKVTAWAVVWKSGGKLIYDSKEERERFLSPTVAGNIEIEFPIEREYEVEV
jgi:hypothetical protein